MMVDQHSSKTEFKKVILKGASGDGLQVKVILTSKGDANLIDLERLYPLNAVRTLVLFEGKQRSLS